MRSSRSSVYFTRTAMSIEFAVICKIIIVTITVLTSLYSIESTVKRICHRVFAVSNISTSVRYSEYKVLNVEFLIKKGKLSNSVQLLIINNNNKILFLHHQIGGYCPVHGCVQTSVHTIQTCM